MKIVYNKLIPFRGYVAMNIFGVYFVRTDYKDRLNNTTFNHEAIHTAQIKELGYIFFYIIYFLEWFIRLFINTNAYRSISFEKEAYKYEKDFSYLDKRKHFAMWRK